MGLCQDGRPTHAPSLWFSQTPDRRAYALSCCRRCPLLAECREYALHAFILDPGVRVIIAGMTERQLCAERRRLGITPPRVPQELLRRKR